MGKVGRPPKPSALKKLQGTHRPDRAVPNELVTQPGVPLPPIWLTKGALEEWQRIVPELEKAGVLTLVDGAALEGYCVNYSLAVEYQLVADNEPMVTNRFDEEVPNPAAAAARHHWALTKMFASEFGLTPSARSRVSVPTGRPRTNPTEDFLFGDGPAPKLEALPGGKN